MYEEHLPQRLMHEYLMNSCYNYSSHHYGQLKDCGFALTSQICQVTNNGILKDVYTVKILKD